MKDAFGNTLNVGDRIIAVTDKIIGCYKYSIVKGTILKLGSNKVTFQADGYPSPYFHSYNVHVIKLPIIENL